jgi:hypothetical protein
MTKLLAVFSSLLQSTTTAQVDKLLSDHQIDKKFHFSPDKYPQLLFKISQEEIIELKKKGSLDNSNTVGDVSGFTPMEKLLYALAWKNGDLQKIKHIVAGIMAAPDDSFDEAIVFRQFGKHLSGRQNEPIIDQHVLRAFALYKFREEPEEIGRYRKLKVITGKDRNLIDDYKAWLSKDLHFELRQIPDYTYHVDKVLFSLGKYIKDQE